MNAQDPEIAFKVDIGFKPTKLSRKEVTASYLEHVNKLKSDPDIEKRARNKERKLKILL